MSAMLERAQGYGSGYALRAHRFLLRVAFAMANVFAWIFVFEYFYVLAGSTERALAATFLMYGLSQAVTIFATPLSAAHLRRGIRASLVWGLVCAAAAYVSLAATLTGLIGSEPAAWGIAAFATLLGLYRALYWVPYTLARAETLPEGFQMQGVYEILIALMPLFTGLTLVSLASAPMRILFGAAVLIGFSALAALALPQAHERFSWSYQYTFGQLFRRKHHALVLNSLLEGLQGAALFLAWPLAIFFIAEWSYFVLGIIFTLSLLSILVLRRVYVRLLKRFRLENSVTVHTVITVSGWVARFAAGTPIGVIVADAYSYATRPGGGTSADFVSEQASDSGAFLDEYTALKEMALAFGKISLCLVAGILVFFVPLPVVFGVVLGIAAAASGLSVLVGRFHSTAGY